jgi:hypothetical protein
MKKILYSVILLITLQLPYSSSFANGFTFIQGSLCSQAQGGAPAPGLLVSLVHPVLGRSAPVYTDRYGNFFMSNIPIRNDLYYLEVYWGQKIIYRNTLMIRGPVTLPRTCI